ncbi:hypothetical protein [Phaeocystidibacter luteus]|nr:hypothetical protein [Phaeocystidibacter luteus]
MKMQSRLLILALPLLFLMASCSPFKQVNSSKSMVEGNRIQYQMVIEKDAKDYLEIIDVKLMNTETGASESATFKIVDTDGSTTLLNLKGYPKFFILATTTDAELNPDQAIVVYKDDPEGDEKSKKIKPLLAAMEEEASAE